VEAANDFKREHSRRGRPRRVRRNKDAVPAADTSSRTDTALSATSTLVQLAATGQLSSDGLVLHADTVLVASGSDPRIWDCITRQLGHSVVPAVPSLFTFKCSDPLLEGLSGLSAPSASVWAGVLPAPTLQACPRTHALVILFSFACANKRIFSRPTYTFILFQVKPITSPAPLHSLTLRPGGNNESGQS
jgi:hypothetical protein